MHHTALVLIWLVGIASSFHPIALALILGVYASLRNCDSQAGRQTPGNFFYPVIAVIAGCRPFVLETIPARIGTMALATVCLSDGILFTASISPENIHLYRADKTYGRYKMCLNPWFGTIYIDFSFGRTLSGRAQSILGAGFCLAVMQGRVQQIWQRSHRILGTLLVWDLHGCFLSWDMNPQLQIIISIMVMQFIIQMLVVRTCDGSVFVLHLWTIFLADSDIGHLHVNELIVTRNERHHVGVNWLERSEAYYITRSWEQQSRQPRNIGSYRENGGEIPNILIWGSCLK